MKYFVISDIHSFAKEMKSALKQAGYKKSDKDSTLIVCGDIFDRGPGTVEVYKYLKTIPTNRLILVRGNHEDLLEDALKKPVPESYDFSNGTVRSVCDMANTFVTAEMIYDSFLLNSDMSTEFEPEQLWKIAVANTKKSECYKWFKSAHWRNYYELDNFIFVHSFIPVVYSEEFSYMNINDNIYKKLNAPEKVFTYNKDWRDSKSDWDYARWCCPYKLFNVGCFDEELIKGKTLVCGHWHTRDFKRFFNTAKQNDEIYFGNGLIGLDGCTAATHNCNVLVIKDGVCFDKYGNKLEVEKSMPYIETVEA